MNDRELAAVLERPEIQARILGGYRGAFALGVTGSPQDSSSPAILLRVEGEVPSGVPKEVPVNGTQVPVVARGGFRRPSKQ